MKSFTEGSRWFRDILEPVTILQMNGQEVRILDRIMGADNLNFPLDELRAMQELWKKERIDCGCAQCLEELL